MQMTRTIQVACAQCGAAPTPICACGRLEAGWVLADQAVTTWMPAVEAAAKKAPDGGDERMTGRSGIQISRSSSHASSDAEARLMTIPGQPGRAACNSDQ
jgi:hypothetical protein